MMASTKLKFSGSALTTLGAAILAATATSAQAAEYEWTFQTSETAGEPQFEMKKAWADNVETMSNGRISIEILPVNAVVQANQTLQAVQSGILQGHLTDPSYFTGQNPAFGMIGNLVGAWSDPYDFLDYMNNAGGEELYNKLVEPYGVHLIGAAATGLESLPSTKPVRSIDDMQGLKLRAPEGMVYNIFEAAGATPVNLPGSEVYTGLEKGVIDAADYTVFATNQAQGLHEFAPYPLYPGFHSLPMVAVSLNKDVWDSLSDDLKGILETSVDALAYEMVAELKTRDMEAVREARQNPDIEIIDLPQEERVAFRNIAKQEWENWAEKNEITQEFYESVVAYLENHNLL
ncbi:MULTISPECIES: TRAP transporter substrate-binding protein [unclassified Halomonas]|uniref:TRAP transporter substrate-binding protein n=1 Tax=Halomonas TaxID=2745 RepID=UPI000D377F52|nr:MULTISPECIES: TRAP transporter substrate-binding protein [unclassified Halomonas]MBR9770454.1 TRAP transporter substrate-binding protein [Gammaproteobacteria bacterium]MBY6112734.1 TRAP transporter substrate-binding protein [Halomonas sp. DP1Y21-3]MCJ8287019.1 TRAP transporter substrate-binding protein [Halomonas sp.]NQY71735.1 TRAP transporter substrate-binding protein [Halomonas sp.]RQW71267.1 TRAP transporter substrate-binding protein [Halomonas sp. YLB-10]|tara:strand:+ start:528 stop:1568 length:1041 start_codon:yes stop_codon:yes gene_type:complete